jgi:hypothetical protein
MIRFPRLRFSLRTLVVFVLLVGSGFGLWWRWEPWFVRREFEYQGNKLTAFKNVSPDGKRWVKTSTDLPYSLHGIAVFRTDPTGGLVPSSECALHTIGCDLWIEEVWFVDDDSILAWGTKPDLDESEWYALLERRRPEYWWGVAWLPEFWFALAFGVGLGWSAWRDRRRLSHKPADTA